MEPILAVQKLGKSYGSVEAVKKVSFEIKPGEIFALIGPNGAGKSTTLRMLATLLRPGNGEATLLGHSLTHEPGEIRKLISYLPEEAGAYKNMRGTTYLRFMAALFTTDSFLQQTYYERGVRLANLGNRLKDKVSTYSKGMTRKLLLARTVMAEPKLAILDEPTSGLDITNALGIRETIRELANNGMAVLLSSHNMLEIEFLSDRVGLINKGALHEIGTPEELKKKYKAKNLEEVFFKATST